MGVNAAAIVASMAGLWALDLVSSIWIPFVIAVLERLLRFTLIRARRAHSEEIP
jgi:hypothetical protein